MSVADLVSGAEKARAQLASLLPLAVETLQELALGAERDNVRLAAAEAILDRTGLSRGSAVATGGDSDQHRQVDLSALDLVSKLRRNLDSQAQQALPSPSLETLVVLEGEQDELPTASPDTYVHVIDVDA